jgi:thioredoxin-like negative regulator of GroEL
MNHHHQDEGRHPVGKTGLSEKEKLQKLLEHWIKHNEEHARTYLEWAEKIESKNLEEIAELLKKASEATVNINELFEKAIKNLS